MWKWAPALVITAVFGWWRISQGEDALKEFRALEQEACACSTVECGRAVTAKLTVLLNKHQSTGASGHQENEARKIGEHVGQCLVKAGVPVSELLAAIPK